VKKLAIVLLTLALPLVACSKSSTTDTSAASAGGSAPGTVTVFGASSLTGAFTEIGKEYEAANPGVKVTFSFGPSDGLAQQIDAGAPATVYASASSKWMDGVQANGPGVTDRANFAQNKLVVITPPIDPAGIKSIKDLADPEVKLVLAAVGVPAGDYAREALDNAGIAKQAEANVVSNEQDDAAVVQKVASGEADAGIVYVSDVAPTQKVDVRAVQIPSADNVIATYPIGVISGSGDSKDAQAFVTFVNETQGQATLKKFGVVPLEVARGAAFDPALHHAVHQAESDELPPNTVSEVFQQGYMLNDRLLRAAMVVVAVPPKIGER
jgi:molybdate transport system substrate-binding protein